jgi:hypothetical protein
LTKTDLKMFLIQVTETVIPMIPESYAPVRQGLNLLRQLCAGCTSQVNGELKLLQGQLSGLAGLTRQGSELTKTTFIVVVVAYGSDICLQIYKCLQMINNWGYGISHCQTFSFEIM